MNRIRTRQLLAASSAALIAGALAIGPVAAGGGGGGQDLPEGPHASQTEAPVSAMASPNRGVPWTLDSPRIDDAIDDDDLTADNPAGIPAGVTPLERDLWNTPNFYLDRDLWSDERYFHCNSLRYLTDMWTADRVSGQTPDIEGADLDALSASARWGQCGVTGTVEHVVSPYPFETAYEHYSALLAEAEGRGGPTDPSYEWLLDVVSGSYNRSGVNQATQWSWGWNFQVPEYLKLLTPEYQTYLMQEMYYEAVMNATMWPAQFYWPEGTTRWWAQRTQPNPRILATPHVISFVAGQTDNLTKRIYVGRSFENETGEIPYLSAEVPRHYGAIIGFWDGDMLVTWLSSTVAWMAHTAMENSDQLQIIEIFTSRYNDSGRHIGWTSEAIFYDPLALEQPIRNVMDFTRDGDIGVSLAEESIRNFIPGLQQQWPVEGRNTPLPGGTLIEGFLTPDWNNRPWAQQWIYYFEQDLELPQGIPGRTDDLDVGILF